MDNMHKPGEPVKKLPNDPTTIKAQLAVRAKPLLAIIDAKQKK